MRVINQRIDRLCPFTGKTCIKRLYRTRLPPSGSCSVSHDGEKVIICPNRFLAENKKLLFMAAASILSSTDVVLVPEITLPEKFGRVDWVAVDRRGERIINFAPIETHANQTTSTGGLTDAIGEHEATGSLSKDRYEFGLNTYHQIKTFFMQCLMKSQLFKIWDRKFIWILDHTVFESWKERFPLASYRFKKKDPIFFFSIDLVLDQGKGMFILEIKDKISTNRDELLKAYSRPPGGLPSETEFISNISRKMNSGHIFRQI